MSTNELSKIYDAVLSSPGMNEMVKIDIRISRKNTLFLSLLIENGLFNEGEKAKETDFPFTDDSVEALQMLKEDFLKKAGLVDLYEKLKIF